jgi:hypothetical protein
MAIGCEDGDVDGTGLCLVVGFGISIGYPLGSDSRWLV